MLLDFGRVGIFQPKKRSIKITNVSHETVSIDELVKVKADRAQDKNDELSIYFSDCNKDYEKAFTNFNDVHLKAETTINSDNGAMLDRFNSNAKNIN